MAKKTFIKLRRGILDAKHIDALGAAWYLFIYILDQAYWDSGKIIGWKDQYAADELGVSISQIRYHRQHLEKKEYIICDKRQYDQIITINKWKDPRENESTQNSTLCDSKTESELSQSMQNMILCDSRVEPELSQSRARVEPELSQTFNDPSINSHLPSNQIPDTRYQIPDTKDIGAEKSAEPHYEPCTEDGEPIKEKKKRKSKADPRTSHPAIQAVRRLTGKYPPKVNYNSVIEVLGDTPDEQKMAESYREWCERGYNTNSLKWLTDWYVNGVHDKRSGKVNANDIVKEMMENNNGN